MRAMWKRAVPAGVFVLIACWGCASPPPSIPTGEWVGQGTYIDQGYETDSGGVRKVKDDTYKPSVTITKRSIAGQEAVVFDILSEHKPQPNSNPYVHIVMALVRPKTLEGGSIQYDAAWALRDSPAPRELSEAEVNKGLQEPDQPKVSCLRAGNALVMHVHYSRTREGKAFTDTLVFEGNRLYKMGHFIDPPRRISWAEQLRKVK